MKEKLHSLFHSPRITLLLAPFALLAPVWLAGKALYWGTPSTQFIPWWWQAWQTLKVGQFPLWNPLVGMGAPLLANYQSALLYPPTWIYFALAALGGLPLMAWGQAILVSLHLAWAGWGMGLLIRRLGRSELAQTVGGLAFALSGYLVARAGFLSINASVSWLPWILLAVCNLAYQPKRVRSIVYLAVCFAMQWLAGHAQIAWYSLLLALTWAAFWAWREGRWQRLVQTALGISVAGLFALGLSAIQLLPTVEYLMNSQRAAQVGFAYAANYSFWPWHLISLVAPNFFGNPVYGNYWGFGNYWEDALYIGLLPLFLVVGFLAEYRKVGKERPLWIFLFATIFVSLLLALGKNTPLFGWLYRYVPTFALFQGPTRFTIWMVFALCLLAALAVDRWRPPNGRRLYWSRLGMAAAGAITAFSILLIWIQSAAALDIPETLGPALLSTGIIAMGIAWLHLRQPSTNGRKRQTWVWLVVGLLCADLFFADWNLNPAASVDLYQEGSFHTELGNGRVYIPGADEQDLKFGYLFQFSDFYSSQPEAIRQNLLPNTNILDGIPSANNFDPFVPARYQDWIEALETAPDLQQEFMLAGMGVTAVEHFGLEGNQQATFETRAALPRARWVNCAQIVSNEKEALSHLSASPDNAAIVVEDPSSPGQMTCGAGLVGTASILSTSANSLYIEVNAPGGGWLLLADTWYPGWHAFVEGDEVEAYPANGAFRAIRLEAGAYTVRLAYQPSSFAWGSGLSILSWLTLVVLVYFERRNAINSNN